MIFEATCGSIKQAVMLAKNLLTASELKKKEFSSIQMQAIDDEVSFVFVHDEMSYRIEIKDAEVELEGAVKLDIAEWWDTLKPFSDKDMVLFVELEDSINIGVRDIANKTEMLIAEEVVEPIQHTKEIKELQPLPRKPMLQQLQIAKKLNRATFTDVTNHTGFWMKDSTCVIRGFNFTTLYQGKIEIPIREELLYFALEKQSLARFVRALSAVKSEEVSIWTEEGKLFLHDSFFSFALPINQEDSIRKLLLSLTFQEITETVWNQNIELTEWIGPLKEKRKENPNRLGISTLQGFDVSFSDDVIPQSFNYPFKPILDISTQLKNELSVGIGKQENGFPLILKSVSDTNKSIIAFMGFEENDIQNNQANKTRNVS